MVKVLRIPGYLLFAPIVFFDALYRRLPMIFSLLEKDVLGFSDDRIVLIGNLMALGGMLGFVLGDVWWTGSEQVCFLCCHFRFSAVLLLVLTRGILMISPLFLMALLTGAFGMIQAASGIAMISETLSLITSENKSLSTGLWMTLYGWYRTFRNPLQPTPKLGVFSNEWSWIGNPMSVYDGLLLICGG